MTIETFEFIDTHCHLQDPAFEGQLDEPLRRARQADVVAMVLCGYDEAANLAALRIAAAHQDVFPAVGYHPHEAKDVTPAMLATLEEQASRPEVVAVGEIGLDFFRDHSPHPVQYEVLAAQLDIAARLGKPVSIHTRGAEDEIYESLRAYAIKSPLAAAGRPPGVMHCFGGTLAQARRYVELGFLISIPCTAGYPKNETGRELARELPLTSIVIETDSPYLPPQQYRGKRNEPAYVRFAAEAVAHARDCLLAEVAFATSANAAALFALPVGATGAVR